MMKASGLRIARHLEPGQFVARCALRGVSRWTGAELLQGLCLTRSSSVPVASSGVVCQLVDRDRLLRECASPGSGLEREKVDSLLGSGEECVGAFVGDVLASHIWFSPGPAHLAGNVFVHFDPAYAFSRWAFTREEFRGQQLHAACKQKALEIYTGKGRQGILSVVYAWNFPSLNAAAGLGCIRVGWMGMVAGKVWTSAGCRRAGMWLGTLDQRESVDRYRQPTANAC